MPPGYSGQGRRTIDDPSSIRALVGSVVTIIGAGSSSGIEAKVGNGTIPVGGSGASWRNAIHHGC
jgi:hypothetical protein